jgi:hypothetical protein
MSSKLFAVVISTIKIFFDIINFGLRRFKIKTHDEFDNLYCCSCL